MNDQRLAQLLRDAENGTTPPTVRDANSIAASARSIRRERQHRNRVISTAAMSLVIVIGSIAMIRWRNFEHDRTTRQVAIAALRQQTDQLEIDASERLDVVQSVTRSRKPPAKSMKSKPKSAPRDFNIDLEEERERASAIIFQAAEQLREAGRVDLANDRFHDLITLFPDTAAGAMARERMEQSKTRT